MNKPREVIDRVTKAAIKGHADTLRSLYADDAVIETPDLGTISGPDAIVEWNGAFRTAFPDLSWEPLHEHDAGNTAIDEGLSSERTPARSRRRTARASRQREGACD
jgi:SnoaL-like domain